MVVDPVSPGTGAGAVSELFARPSAGDTEGAATDDVMIEVPFQPVDKGFWGRVSGRPALLRFLSLLPALFDDFSISTTETYALVDQNRVIVPYRSDAVLRATGRPYRNDYIGVFRFSVDGLIREWTEFHNPRVILQAFDREGTYPDAP